MADPDHPAHSGKEVSSVQLEGKETNEMRYPRERKRSLIGLIAIGTALLGLVAPGPAQVPARHLGGLSPFLGRLAQN